MTNIDWTAVLLFSTFLSFLFCCVLLRLLYNAYREVHQLKLVRDALQEEVRILEISVEIAQHRD